MPTQHCQCGARYRFADSSVGKRAKCKKCGAVLTLSGDDELVPIPIAGERIKSEQTATRGAAVVTGPGNAPVCPGCRLTLPISAKICVDCGIDLATGRKITTSRESSLDGAADKPRTYAQDILATFLFPTSLRNGITFVFLWVALFVLQILGGGGAFGLGLFALVRFVCYLAFLGWWASYRFNVVASGAAGDTDLPSLMVPSEGFGALLMVFFRWLASWIIVFIPAAVFLVVASVNGWMDLDGLDAALDNGVAGLLFFGTGPAEVAFGLLVGLGLFVWPIIILCVALGGFACLGRVDLIVTTLIRTFPVYAFTAAMVVGTDFVKFVLAESVSGRLDGTQEEGSVAWIGVSVLIRFLILGIGVYFEIVAMRIIGLYYHHFKDRFAWSWG